MDEVFSQNLVKLGSSPSHGKILTIGVPLILLFDDDDLAFEGMTMLACVIVLHEQGGVFLVGTDSLTEATTRVARATCLVVGHETSLNIRS